MSLFLLTVQLFGHIVVNRGLSVVIDKKPVSLTHSVLKKLITTECIEFLVHFNCWLLYNKDNH